MICEFGMIIWTIHECPSEAEPVHPFSLIIILLFWRDHWGIGSHWRTRTTGVRSKALLSTRLRCYASLLGVRPHSGRKASLDLKGRGPAGGRDGSWSDSFIQEKYPSNPWAREQTDWVRVDTGILAGIINWERLFRVSTLTIHIVRAFAVVLWSLNPCDSGLFLFLLCYLPLFHLHLWL